MKINTKRLFLEELKWKDLEDFHYFSSIPEIREYSTLPVPKDILESKKRLQSIIDSQNNNPRGSYNWKVLLKKTGTFLGLCGIKLSLDKFKLGEIYYEVHPDFWGNGYATEIAEKLIEIGFEKFNLHKVEAGVATDNVSSIRVLEKTKMIREGKRRKILPIRGEWRDNYHYAIVEDDPRK